MITRVMNHPQTQSKFWIRWSKPICCSGRRCCLRRRHAAASFLTTYATFGCRGWGLQRNHGHGGNGWNAGSTLHLEFDRTRTRLATFWPLRDFRLKRQRRAACTAARSRLRLPLDSSTSTSSTPPLASMLTTRTVVPWMPRRCSPAGAFGGSSWRARTDPRPSSCRRPRQAAPGRRRRACTSTARGCRAPPADLPGGGSTGALVGGAKVLIGGGGLSVAVAAAGGGGGGGGGSMKVAFTTSHRHHPAPAANRRQQQQQGCGTQARQKLMPAMRG